MKEQQEMSLEKVVEVFQRVLCIVTPSQRDTSSMSKLPNSTHDVDLS